MNTASGCRCLLLYGILLLIAFIAQVACEKDFYAVLGVPKSATQQEIKRAYRKKSLIMHPDKPTGDTEKFQALTEAYGVLSDKGKRDKYDRYGEEGLKNGGRNRWGGGGHPFEDIFEFHFGGGHRQGPRRSDDVEVFVEVTLEDLYQGRMIEVNRVLSTGDEGTRDETVSVYVEKGMAHGDRIVFSEEGDKEEGKVPGDLVFTVLLIPHHKYELNAPHLKTTMKINFVQSLVGFKKEIPFFGGEVVVVERDGITEHGQVVVLRGEGMPVKDSTDSRGNIYVTINVDFPKTLTGNQKQVLRDIFGS